ncbi:hypothetical protein GCM10028784_30300 [Myceligenerans cantabricum]
MTSRAKIPVEQGLEGMLETDLTWSETRDGTAMLRGRVRVERWRASSGGPPHRLPPVFCTLVVFNEHTQKARAHFQAGDAILASGRLRALPSDEQGKERHVFVARRLGHDAARTRYQVVRTLAQARARRAAARRRRGSLQAATGLSETAGSTS